MSYGGLLYEEHKDYSFKGHTLQSESSCHLLLSILSAKFCSKNCGFNLTTIKIYALMQLDMKLLFFKGSP